LGLDVLRPLEEGEEEVEEVIFVQNFNHIQILFQRKEMRERKNLSLHQFST